MTPEEIKQILLKKQIKYSKNWNNKLYLDYYTSIRLHDEYWKVGDYYRVYLNNSCQHYAQIILKKTFLLKDLPEVTAYSDTGMNAMETRQLFRRMYPAVNFDTQPMDLILFHQLDIQPHMYDDLMERNLKADEWLRNKKINNY